MMNLTANFIAQFKYKGFIKHHDPNMKFQIGFDHQIRINPDHKDKRILTISLKNICVRKYKEFLQDNSYLIATDFHPEKKKKFREQFTKIIPMLRKIFPEDISLQVGNGCLNGIYFLYNCIYFCNKT